MLSPWPGAESKLGCLSLPVMSPLVGSPFVSISSGHRQVSHLMSSCTAALLYGHFGPFCLNCSFSLFFPNSIQFTYLTLTLNKGQCLGSCFLIEKTHNGAKGKATGVCIPLFFHSAWEASTINWQQFFHTALLTLAALFRPHRNIINLTGAAHPTL